MKWYRLVFFNIKGNIRGWGKVGARSCLIHTLTKKKIYKTTLNIFIFFNLTSFRIDRNISVFLIAMAIVVLFIYHSNNH